MALEGWLEEAFTAVQGDGVVAEWNRFVLRPDRDRYDALLRRLPEDLIPLLQAAGYAFGITEEPGADGNLDGELRAVVLLTIASHHLEREQTTDAIALLEEALASAREASPLLAAQILHQIADVERPQAPVRAIQRYKEAIQLAGDTPLASLRAELWLNLGIAWQEAAEGRRAPLLEAAQAYQKAIRCGLSLEYLPELYALAQSNLALAYLTLPAREASDQLRMGIAVQGLREALKVFRRDTHPELWASAQLNLANALQYMPSSHPEQNLEQAVHLYEELLEVRNKALDPLAYARLLANQGNALAHLGIFQPALEKLNEAHKLFHWHGEPAMAASILDLTAEINGKIVEAPR
ncbi:MAG TPA: hypothetical protein VG672_19530 [Bryobacteraceae bacterium]|nr:hypothetical protein [Bryobacteraceae bacterium]